jgi:multicomponent K+:H+ antiporter subunit E
MTSARKLVPAPLLSIALVAVWLLLARSSSLGQVALGITLGLAVPLLVAHIRPKTVRVRHPLVIARYIAIVGHDVLVSNFAVAWGVVAWRWQKPRARFVTIPLDLREPVGLVVLAMVTTVVPGTVWSELALDRSALLLHAWNVADEDAFIARFKNRYEKPLREIFE